MQKLFLKLILFLIFISVIYSQEIQNSITVSDTFFVSVSKEIILSKKIVFPGSVKFWHKSQLLNNSQIKYNSDSNSYIFPDNLNVDTLIVTYKTLLLNLNYSYQKRKLSFADIPKDSASFISNEKVYKAITANSIFGSNISRSGSISRGFTVSTNKDMTVNSGLNLQLSGKISDDIEITAALSDQNLPFQAEGNTERLEELDKVFIQIKHQNFNATFGDYELRQSAGLFGKVNKKLKGLNANFNYKNINASVSIANSRGKFHSNIISGADGIQGPYRLRGKNNEREIIIIAGSEKVYLDGIEMNRGENNDYIIDYSTSEVTFTPNRLITSKSRIVVDFEYSDQKYSRSYFNSLISTKLFDEKLNLTFSYSREGDDETSPVELELSDEEKEVLRNAGTNRFDAYVSGVREVEADSNGVQNGYYIKIDSLINGSEFIYYKYGPGNDEALYSVTFSYVGDGEGDYKRLSLGNYYFVGIGKGDYLPIKLLPLPEILQKATFTINALPLKDLTLDLDLAASSFNQNKFDESVNDEKGFARNILIKYSPKEMNLFDIKIPELKFIIRDRFIGKDFASYDRIDDVEFNRDYNSDLTSQKTNEHLNEYEFGIVPIKNLSTSLLIGTYKKDDLLSTDRINYNFNLNEKNISANYKLNSTDTKLQNYNNKWLKQDGYFIYRFNNIDVGLNYVYDNNEKFQEKDSLLIDSYKYSEITPFFEFKDVLGMQIKTSVSSRFEYKPLSGNMIKEAESISQNYNIDYNKNRNVKTSLTLKLRNKKYTEEFTDSENSETVLLRSQSRINLFKRFLFGSFYYETSTQRSARYQKIFVRVPQGTGNYKYLGDLNNNGLAEENEFEPTIYDGDFIVTVIPTEEMYPIIDLKTNLRFRLDFKKLTDKKSTLGKLVSAFQTETIYRIEENSRIKDISKIYLLKQDYFLNDSTTVKGSNIFQQDLYLNRGQKDFSLRLRYLQRRRLYQYSTGSERGYYRERGVKIKFNLVKEFSNETEYLNITDNNLAPLNTNRSRIINTNSISSEIIYKPVREIESSFKFIVNESIDSFPETPTNITSNSQILKVNYLMANKGRFRLELERNEMNSDNQENYIPFEISKGNSIGLNYYIRFYFDYKINSFIQTSFNYNSRKNGSNDFIHSMRAEARAYF